MDYKAYLVEELDGVYSGSIKKLHMNDIESGNVIIKVHYSSLNYKDALAASGVKGVTSSYPFVPDGYRLKHAPAKQDSGSKQAALELLQQLESEISRW